MFFKNRDLFQMASLKNHIASLWMFTGPVFSSIHPFTRHSILPCQPHHSMADDQWREAGPGLSQRGHVEWFSAGSWGAPAGPTLRAELDQARDDHDRDLVSLLTNIIQWYKFLICWSSNWKMDLCILYPSITFQLYLCVRALAPSRFLTLASFSRQWETGGLLQEADQREWSECWPGVPHRLLPQPLRCTLHSQRRRPHGASVRRCLQNWLWHAH